MAIQQRTVNGSYTEIYTGGGNFLTQSYPTNFHVFTPSKVLGKDESVDDWREVTPAEKAALEKADSEWVRPAQELIDRWNSYNYSLYLGKAEANIQYNEETGYFECREYKDITAEEAILMLEDAIVSPGDLPYRFCNKRQRFRTNLTQWYVYNAEGYDAAYMCMSSGIERLRIVDSAFIYMKNVDHMFWGADKLVSVEPLMNVTSITSFFQFFYNNKKLEHLLLQNIRQSIDISQCPKLSYESLKYWVENASASSPIIFTVHSGIYQAIQGEAEYPFNGGSRDEWTQLLVDAVAKNITFATA